ncbi:hypothetical protein BS78_02G137400 [Paspalum vaginatum]|nr:hypothetical protein BS78_02G137400 [Paspalum vaginatum]
MSPGLTQQPTAHQPDPATVITTLIADITGPVAQPVLQAVQQKQRATKEAKAHKTKKKQGCPVRRSARSAAIAWPCGDIQTRARQVFMKCLGLAPEENQSLEPALQRYLNLFKGPPLAGLVLKALEALCGLEDPRASSHAAA